MAEIPQSGWGEPTPRLASAIFPQQTPRLRLDPLVLHQDQCLSCTNSQERVRKYLFFFPLIILLSLFYF